jgi:hypothetical protein
MDTKRKLNAVAQAKWAFTKSEIGATRDAPPVGQRLTRVVKDQRSAITPFSE